jgi:glycerol-3-phosphate acyltransferase PlsY
VAVVAGVVVLGAYLLGTFPTAALVGRREGVDPSLAGSGNPGASNTYRLAGRQAGALVLAGDVVKGAVAAGVGLAVGEWVGGGRSLGFAAGLAAVLGHVAPVTRRFHGGKGVATAAGVAIVLLPVPAAIAGVVFVAVAVTTRTASAASLAAVATLVLAAAVERPPALELLATIVIALLIVVRHRGNLVRLRHGDERTIEGF